MTINLKSLFLSFLVSLVISHSLLSQEQEETSIKINLPDGASPYTHLNWQNDSENFQFVIVTDRTGGAREGVFKQGVKRINSLRPEFVLSVGDLIEGYTDNREQAIKEWDDFDQIVEPLEMPFFYLPGNHDFYNEMSAEVWGERYGPSYYHFIYRDVLFLCLNTEEEYNNEEAFFSDDQMEFIRQTLDENPDVRWTMVILHKPLWLLERFEGEEALEMSGWADIETILKERKHTVIAGHVHRYIHDTRHKSNYITMATMGGSRGFGSPIFGQFDHVMWVTMTDEGPIMANLMLEGIWDEDFSKEDIADYLFLTMHGTSIVLESEFDDENPLTSREVVFKLSNPHDIPMAVSLNFDRGEHLFFEEETIQKTIPPNSVEKVSVTLNVTTETTAPEDEEDENTEDPFWKVWKDLQYHPVRWEISYDFEEYGQVSFQGKTLLYW